VNPFKTITCLSPLFYNCEDFAIEERTAELKEIAKFLNVSTTTIDSHRRSIRKKNCFVNFKRLLYHPIHISHHNKLIRELRAHQQSTVSSTTVNAITINASNVTIDLNGHVIDGPGPGSGYGIYASATRYNIAVMNGTVRDFGHIGVYLAGKNNIVKDMRAYNNFGNGIYVYYGAVTNCAAYGNGNDGIYANHSTVTNCTANNNVDDGIHAENSTVTNCTANDNNNYGINAETCIITNCTAKENTIGIDANHSTITNCTGSNNGDDGISALSSTLTNCTAYDNTDEGIYAGNSTVTNCTANYNDGDGIQGCYTNRIEGNNLRYNGAYGLYLSSDNNYAIRNTASNNTSGNFYEVGTNYMPISGDNANYGW
jgi:parallel beta-helix repeat protein